MGTRVYLAEAEGRARSHLHMARISAPRQSRVLATLATLFARAVGRVLAAHSARAVGWVLATLFARAVGRVLGARSALTVDFDKQTVR